MIKGTAYEYRNVLEVFEDEESIVVKGGTFKYEFDKKSGLIQSLEILGEDFLVGTDSQIPDIYVSDKKDPRQSFYAAKYEDKARCEVISSNPHEVHIRTHGTYHSPSGDVFPIRYRITYEIQSDGTIFIIVHNKAYDPCVIRWLCISRGILNPSLCQYFSHLADQSKTDTTSNYTFKDMPVADSKDQPLFSGRLIPWFWLGNDITGVEFCLWDVTYHRYGATYLLGKLADPLGEVGANVSSIKLASEKNEGVLWEIFSIRNLQTPLKDGWEQVNYFSMSITPPKHYNPEFNDLRAYHEGKRLYNSQYKYLTDDQIVELSRKGYNLIISDVNWRYGEFVPDDEAELRRVIDTCHKNGIKIIPCIPLMDLDEKTDIFHEHGPDWRIEPVIEYEYETNLMCPGAEEWREYWKQQIDRIVQEYDFDGACLDFWYDKLACRNPKHGCQRRYMRPTFTWVREMIAYASEKFKGKNPESIIASNTDLLPISMICSWLDARLVGASQDIRHINLMTGKAFYSSYRLGCDSMMLTDRIQKIDNQIISLSLLYMAPIVLSEGRSPEETELVLSYLNVLRFFGINEAIWYPGFIDNPKIKVANSDNPDLYVNVHSHDEVLLTLINLSPNEIKARLSITNTGKLGLDDDKKYIIYEPLARKFLPGREKWLCSDLSLINIDMAGYTPRLLYIRQIPDNPSLIYALGADSLLEENWDETVKQLKIKISATPKSDLAISIYSPFGRPSRVNLEGRDIIFDWDESQKIVVFDVEASEINITEISLDF